MAQTLLKSRNISVSKGTLYTKSWVDGSSIYFNVRFSHYSGNFYQGYGLIGTVQRYVNGAWTEIERKQGGPYWVTQNSGVTFAFTGYVKKGTPVRVRFAIASGSNAGSGYFAHNGSFTWYNMPQFTL